MMSPTENRVASLLTWFGSLVWGAASLKGAGVAPKIGSTVLKVRG